MRTVGSYEAKTHLPRLLDEVAKGERITITKRGVPVAVLSPAGEERRQDVKRAIAKLKRLRKGARRGGLTIREMIEDGRV